LPASAKQSPAAAVPLVMTVLSQLDDIDSWYPLSAVGTRLLALMTDFDPRTYGCAKLVTLIEKAGAFDVRRNALRVYIRPKKD
jgi:hypothetical protein